MTALFDRSPMRMWPRPSTTRLSGPELDDEFITTDASSPPDTRLHRCACVRPTSSRARSCWPDGSRGRYGDRFPHGSTTTEVKLFGAEQACAPAPASSTWSSTSERCDRAAMHT